MSIEIQFVTLMGTEWMWRDFNPNEANMIVNAMGRQDNIVGISRVGGQRLQCNISAMTLIDVSDGYTQSIRWRPSSNVPWKEPSSLMCERQQMSVANGKLMKATEAKKVRQSTRSRGAKVNAAPVRVPFGQDPKDLNGRDMLEWLKSMGFGNFVEKLQKTVATVEKLAYMEMAEMTKAGIPLGVAMMVQEHARTYKKPVNPAEPMATPMAAPMATPVRNRGPMNVPDNASPLALAMHAPAREPPPQPYQAPEPAPEQLRWDPQAKSYEQEAPAWTPSIPQLAGPKGRRAAAAAAQAEAQAEEYDQAYTQAVSQMANNPRPPSHLMEQQAGTPAARGMPKPSKPELWEGFLMKQGA